MKQLLLALAIGLTAMGCSRYGQEDNSKNTLTKVGYVNRSFCKNGFVIYEIKNDTMVDKTYLPTNLPNEFKSQTLKLHTLQKEMKVEFTYKVISDIPQVCPGFYGYDKEIKLINIKKID